MRFLVRLRAHNLLRIDLTMCVYSLIITEWAMRLLYVIQSLLANTPYPQQHGDDRNVDGERGFGEIPKTIAPSGCIVVLAFQIEVEGYWSLMWRVYWYIN